MKIIIKGIPLAKQSARFAKIGNYMKSYQPKKVTNWQEDAKAQLISQLPDNWIPISEPIIIEELEFRFTPLKNWTKKKLTALDEGEIIYKSTKPDVDNLIKSWDFCNGVLWVDDAQVVAIQNLSKVYSRSPGITLRLKWITPTNTTLKKK